MTEKDEKLNITTMDIPVLPPNIESFTMLQIRKFDWDKIRSDLEQVQSPNPWFVEFCTLFLGMTITALFTIFQPFQELDPFLFIVYVGVTIVFGFLALGFYLFHERNKKMEDIQINSIIGFMDKISEYYTV